MIFNEIFSSVAESVGWTLVHSIWQSALIVLVTFGIITMIPTRLAKVRYSVACIGMIGTISAALFTLVSYESMPSNSLANNLTPLTEHVKEGWIAETSQRAPNWMAATLSSSIVAIQQNMRLIVSLWIVGMLLFSIRIITGWIALNNLKSNAVAISGHWSDQLKNLAENLGIRQEVLLAENVRITTPMVVGFLKPIIMIPTGMLTGLTAEQIETIFLHELAHIRRYDYIINLLQVFIETIFFFNPFVWILSNMIRREREYCCDDAVVNAHGSKLAYAHALAQLEEWKLNKSTFALALAANKNQLLNRIKRLMEKSGQNYSSKHRFVPAVLLIVGLVCASWLTVHKENRTQSEKFLQGDTTVKGKTSRTTIIRFDEDGEAHEQVFEEIDRESDFFALVPGVPGLPPDFDKVEIPEVPWDPAVPGRPADLWIPGLMFPRDTVPGSWNSTGRDWEKFSEEFEKQFSEKFEDFYKNHEKDFDMMMKEMEGKFKDDFEAANLGSLEALKAMRVAELAELKSLEALKHLDLAEIDLARERAQIAIDAVPPIPAIAAIENMAADLQGMQHHLQGMSESMERFKKELKESLVADGYLKKDEEIKSITWEDDLIEINGKKIKDSDVKRYQKKHGKSFENDFHFNRIE